MTKAEIVNNISEKIGVEKNTALAVVEALMLEVKDAVKHKNPVYLRGFGTFSAKKRKEKTGRNISKNTTIIIPEHHVPSFKPSKSFKQEVKAKID